MYIHANGNGKAELQIYHEEFPERRMLDHTNFERLHPHLRETVFVHVAKTKLVDEEIQGLKKAS